MVEVYCAYARMEKLACAVFHLLSCVEECSEARFTQLYKLLFLRLLLVFLRFCYPLLVLRSDYPNNRMKLLKDRLAFQNTSVKAMLSRKKVKITSARIFNPPTGFTYFTLPLHLW